MRLLKKRDFPLGSGASPSVDAANVSTSALRVGSSLPSQARPPLEASSPAFSIARSGFSFLRRDDFTPGQRKIPRLTDAAESSQVCGVAQPSALCASQPNSDVVESSISEQPTPLASNFTLSGLLRASRLRAEHNATVNGRDAGGPHLRPSPLILHGLTAPASLGEAACRDRIHQVVSE